MSKTRLTVEISHPSVSVLQAVRFLMRDDRLSVSIRRTRTPRLFPERGVLRIERASLLYPALVVLWGDSGGVEEPRRNCDAEAALSELAWEGHLSERPPWLETANALPRYSRLGTPDPDRPWVLLAPHSQEPSAAPLELAGLTGLEAPQPHELAPSVSFERDGVVWLPWRGTLAALLGHVDAVVGFPGPLTWDAHRLGVPVFTPARLDDAMTRLAFNKLANMVPPALVEHGPFWRSLATSLLQYERGPTAGTLLWIQQARTLTASAQLRHSPLARARRKLRKLQRDPRAFFADSWLSNRARSILGQQS